MVGMRSGCFAGEWTCWHSERRSCRNWSRVVQMMMVLGEVRGWRMKLRKRVRDSGSKARY